VLPDAERGGGLNSTAELAFNTPRSGRKIAHREETKTGKQQLGSKSGCAEKGRGRAKREMGQQGKSRIVAITQYTETSREKLFLPARAYRGRDIAQEEGESPPPKNSQQGDRRDSPALNVSALTELVGAQLGTPGHMHVFRPLVRTGLSHLSSPEQLSSMPFTDWFECRLSRLRIDLRARGRNRSGISLASAASVLSPGRAHRRQ